LDYYFLAFQINAGFIQKILKLLSDLGLVCFWAAKYKAQLNKIDKQIFDHKTYFVTDKLLKY